jgi:rRNA maturation endonuclease Nob1
MKPHEFKPVCVMCYRKHPCPEAKICKVCGGVSGGSVHT